MEKNDNDTSVTPISLLVNLHEGRTLLRVSRKGRLCDSMGLELNIRKPRIQEGGKQRPRRKRKMHSRRARVGRISRRPKHQLPTTLLASIL